MERKGGVERANGEWVQEDGRKVTGKEELEQLKVSLEAIMAVGRRPLSRSSSRRPQVVPRQEVKNEILLKIKGGQPVLYRCHCLDCHSLSHPVRISLP